jgi:N utilization substance protein B
MSEQVGKRGGGKRGPSPRRVSRERVLRALYQWLLAGGDYAALLGQAETHDFEESSDATLPHEGFLRELLEGVLKEAANIDAALAPHLDRPVAELSPVEHAILLIGAFELTHSLNVPYKVCINEAVELAKLYGGTDGHKFVNGVLDKLAKVTRQIEIEAAARS